MASSSIINVQDIQIAASYTRYFLQDVPNCFHLGSDGQLHHDNGQLNVISHKKNFFADAYPEVLIVEDLDAFLSLKEKLLSLPIYMSVQIEAVKNYGAYRETTRSEIVVMVNTKHPCIQTQMREKLEQAEAACREGKNFALEFDFNNVLCQWYREHTNDYTCSNYRAWRSNFCVTNFSQRCRWCINPVGWILCLPVCLAVAPLHCGYRALVCHDYKLNVKAPVTYVKPTPEQERAVVMQLTRRL